MNNIFHTNLEKKWKEYSLYEQMANIGTEVGRAINWRREKLKFYSTAFENL